MKKKKFLICGLDNSGKTSFILSLQRNNNLLSYYSLEPTKGLNIANIIDKDESFVLWELGGQEKYRNDYLKDFSFYTQDVSKIIFLIDVQDPNRYELALDYFKKIIGYFRENKLFPDVSVFFHKCDPNIEEKIKPQIETIKNKLIPEIQKTLIPEFQFSIFKSTIFTIFQKKKLF